MNELLLYKENKTKIRAYLQDKNLKDVIKKIGESPLKDYEYRTGLTGVVYLKTRKSIDNIINRKFIDKKKRISLEHAQKFYLYEYGIWHKKNIAGLGYIVTYELPFFKNRKGGAIDLVAYDKDKKTINLIEMKNCAMGSKKDSQESLIRAILEIETYTKFFKNIKNNKLLSEIASKLKELYNIDVGVDELKKCQIKKILLIPKSLYDYSFENKWESAILVNMPADIKVCFISLKNKDFKANQKIVDVAKEPELIFDIREKSLKELLESKGNITEQLLVLRKYRDRKDVQEYISELERDTTDYVRYLIARYYYGDKNAIKAKKTPPEKMFKLILRVK